MKRVAENPCSPVKNAKTAFKASFAPLCLAALMIIFSAQVLAAADTIILSRAGARNDALWNSFKKYLAGRGLSVSAYESPETIEKQVETANKINKERAAFMLVVELTPADRTDAYIAISDAKKTKGMILNADEVPGSHATRSQELALAVAAPFRKKVKPAALFMLLGIDAPAVFVRLEVTRDRPSESFDMLYDGMMNYMKRGVKNERELKGERRNTPPQD